MGSYGDMRDRNESNESKHDWFCTRVCTGSLIIHLLSYHHHRSIAFSPSYYRSFTIVLSCFHHRAIVFYSHRTIVFSPSYYRTIVIVVSRFHHRTIVVSSSYYRSFTIVLSRSVTHAHISLRGIVLRL